MAVTGRDALVRLTSGTAAMVREGPGTEITYVYQFLSVLKKSYVIHVQLIRNSLTVC